MMKPLVLVTGATGFTGGHLAHELKKQGYAVRALVRDLDRAKELAAAGIDLALGDLRDKESLRVAMRGVHTVYHIAALFRPENVTEQDMWDANAHGVQHMLDAAVEASVQRFVHCSTIGVHGEVKNPPGDEETPYGPGDYYQESKTDGERIAIEYMQTGKLPVVIFRPGGIYGPGDDRFLKLFRSIKNKRFIMFGSGEVLYQLVYIEDLVRGIILCGTKEEAVGNIYILTGKRHITLNEMVGSIANAVGERPPRLKLPVMPLYLAGWACELICKPFGISPPIYRRRVDFFRKDRAFKIDKAQRELGYEPSVSEQDGIRLTAAWYEKMGML